MSEKIRILSLSKILLVLNKKKKKKKKSVAQEESAVQDNLTGAGGLTQPNANKIFFLFPKTKRMN